MRREIERLEPSLRIVAEDVLTVSARIDLVGVDRQRRLIGVAIAETGREGTLLTGALAHRRWLTDHVADWLKIAPDLGADPAAPPRILLVAPGFDGEALAAAAALPEGWIELVRIVETGAADQRWTWLERLPVPAPRRGDGATRRSGRPEDLLPPFRSGLTAQDLGLSDEESAHFD